MSFNEIKEFNLSSSLNSADKILAERSPKANFLLNIGVKKSRGKYLKLCFSYLRWVDDIVDNPQLPVSHKRNFINRQLKLLSDYRNNIFTSIECVEESFLFYFIQYGKEQGNEVIINSVRLMIEGLEMDVQRTEHDGIFSEVEMNTYVSKMSKSFFDVTTCFILPEDKYPYNDIIVTTASTKIWMIRDLQEDFELGYVNITRENLLRYGININNLPHSDNLKKYLYDEINKIIELLMIEAKIIKQFPMRLKLFNYYTQIYYLPKIFRVKAYGYHPTRVDDHRKIKFEVAAYLLTIKFSLKLFILEFFDAILF